jgi:hypothetical protein
VVELHFSVMIGDTFSCILVSKNRYLLEFDSRSDIPIWELPGARGVKEEGDRFSPIVIFAFAQPLHRDVCL